MKLNVQVVSASNRTGPVGCGWSDPPKIDDAATTAVATVLTKWPSWSIYPNGNGESCMVSSGGSAERLIFNKNQIGRGTREGERGHCSRQEDCMPYSLRGPCRFRGCPKRGEQDGFCEQ